MLLNNLVNRLNDYISRLLFLVQAFLPTESSCGTLLCYRDLFIQSTYGLLRVLTDSGYIYDMLKGFIV